MCWRAHCVQGSHLTEHQQVSTLPGCFSHPPSPSCITVLAMSTPNKGLPSPASPRRSRTPSSAVPARQLPFFCVVLSAHRAAAAPNLQAVSQTGHLPPTRLSLDRRGELPQIVNGPFLCKVTRPPNDSVSSEWTARPLL